MKDHSFALAAATFGPGWFDSSRELRAGLDVVEADRLELDLPAWIDAFLAASPAQPRASRVASPSAITAIA